MNLDVGPRESPFHSWPGRISALLVVGGWAVGPSWILGGPDGRWLTLSGLPLIALLLGFGRSLPAPAREGLALAAPLGFLWTLNHRSLGFWWMGDDPCHLVQVLDFGVWSPFVHSVGYFLTPLLNASLGLDLKLFGLDPGAFYAHQLLSFAILILIGYALLRTALTAAFSGFAMALFIASSPAVAVAQQQMNRHYLEGLVLLLASFALYRRSRISGRLSTAVLGSAAYLLSTAAKEVFVPLVLLLPFFEPSTPHATEVGARWRSRSPYALALGFYGFWRLSMLGWDNSLSAYGALSGEFHVDVLLRRLPRQLGWNQPWHGLLFLALLATAVWSLSRHSKRLAGGFGAALILLALPLIAVAGQPEPRHLFVGALLVAATLSAALQLETTNLADPWGVRLRAGAGAGLLLLALGALSGAPIWSQLERSAEDYRTEGRFLLESSRRGMLLTTLPHTHHLECLARLRLDFLRQTAGPGFCGDLCYCSRTFLDEPLWRAAEGQIVPVADRAPGDCAVLREIEVDMRHDRRRGRLSWQLGPYEDGIYRALLLSRVGRPGVSIPIAIPRQGSMQYRAEEPLRFVVQYQSPDGWLTYSPGYVVEPGGTARIDESPGGEPISQGSSNREAPDGR